MSEEKKKILLVEDDVFVRDIYNTKFSKEGYEVVMAENGVEALKKLETITPNIILLDIVMPYMDGLETLTKIRENKDWEKIPIIMLTNLSDRDRVEYGMEHGASEYLIKSHFTPTEVMSKVKLLLGE
jgi:DNA-binding response OmpR family regulator